MLSGVLWDVKHDAQNVAFPPTDTSGCELVQKPGPIDRFTEFLAYLAYPSKKEPFRLVQQ